MFTGSCPEELEDAISVKIFSVSVESMQCEYLQASVCNAKLCIETLWCSGVTYHRPWAK